MSSPSSQHLVKDYTVFFTAVETGDLETVKSYLKQEGGVSLNPMQSYRMDGKMTTPIKSALRRGDSALAVALLDSGKVKVNLHDLLFTSKNIVPTNNSLLIKKLAHHMLPIENNDSVAVDLDSMIKSHVKQNRFSLSRVNTEFAKAVMSTNAREEDEEEYSTIGSEEEEDEEDDGEEETLQSSSSSSSEDDEEET